MKDKPILFSAPMVQAILRGDKTQTRRIIKGVGNDNHMTLRKGAEITTHVLEAVNHDGLIPFKKGDHLWVRETWRTIARLDGVKPSEIPVNTMVSYDADYPTEPNNGCRGVGRPSIFMPRWASRITLKVEDVRVELLRNITEYDAQAEGCAPAFEDEFGIVGSKPYYKYGFRQLWNSLNEQRGYGWDANPWVVAVSFQQIKQAETAVAI